MSLVSASAGMRSQTISSTRWFILTPTILPAMPLEAGPGPAEQLRRSLTWDRGKEMGEHVRFTIDTGVQVHFCDPHSPWRRGSNENTNGLLRQYFPKGNDLSVHDQAHLHAVARELNGRPRQTLGWMKPSEALARIVAMTDGDRHPPQVIAMRRMQAAGIDAFGGEVRVLKLAAPASPAPDEVVISVRAAGVGNWDEFVRVGNWDVGRRPPLALGVEAAGVVAAAGEDVTSLAPGDEVLTHPLPLRHQGAWAEWLVAPAALVARKPASVPWAAAAAFPVPALTADQALTEAAPVRPGEWLLVHGAGGVTGGLAVRLAVARGATVVATAGPSSAARIRGDGARAVFDYHDPEWPTLVRNATPGGRGVGTAVNAVRGGAATALQTVADGGHLATITGDPPSPQRGVTVANIYVRADGARLAALVAALADGLLSLHVGATFPLADAATALQGAVTGRAAGATVLTLEGISSDAADHK